MIQINVLMKTNHAMSLALYRVVYWGTEYSVPGSGGLGRALGDALDRRDVSRAAIEVLCDERPHPSLNAFLIEIFGVSP